MPSELVLLSEVAPTEEQLVRVGREQLGSGSAVRYRDGEITQFLDAAGASLLTVFPTLLIEDAREATVALKNPPTAFALWTDLTVPFGDHGAGRQLADALALAVGGTISERA